MTTSRPRIGLPRVVAVIAALAMVLASFVGVRAAQADVLEDAVTSVQIREESADRYAMVHVDIEWTVPNGTQEGDTFTVELPPILEIAAGLTAELKVPGTDIVVANAAVVDGQLVVTMTSFAEEHENVRGSVWVEARFSSEAVVGETNDVEFVIGTDTFQDAVEVTTTGTGDTGAVYKWGSLQYDSGDRVMFGIHAGRPEGSNYDITITDNGAAGLAIDCTSIEFWGLDYDENGDFEANWLADDERQMNNWVLNSCDENGFTATYTVASWHSTNGVNWVPRVTYFADVIDDTVASWKNSGIVGYPGDVEIPFSVDLQNPAIGGEGDGDNPPTPTPSPTPSESPSPSPTPEPPTTPGPTNPTPTPRPTTPLRPGPPSTGN